MASNMEDYWGNEIRSYDGKLDTGPDNTHDWWKWREFLKLGRIMNAEIKCKVRMSHGHSSQEWRTAAEEEADGHSRESKMGVYMDTRAHAAAHHGTGDKEKLL
nr:MAG TPA: hypothetical protein [Caudoviricetes sp.]